MGKEISVVYHDIANMLLPFLAVLVLSAKANGGKFKRFASPPEDGEDQRKRMGEFQAISNLGLFRRRDLLKRLESKEISGEEFKAAEDKLRWGIEKWPIVSRIDRLEKRIAFFEKGGKQ
jgi:hypothetical protein